MWTKASPSPLSSRAKPRDLQFSPPHPMSTWKRRPFLCHPERSRGICSKRHSCAPIPPDLSPLSSRAKPRDLQFSSTRHPCSTKASPFPLSSRAKPRDLQFFPPRPCGRKRRPPLCHPERSRGICSSFHRIHAGRKRRPLPLSSRAKPRDLQFARPAANADRSTRRNLQSPGFVSGHDF